MRECCICICVYCYRLPSRSHGATSNTISSIIINDYQRQDGLGVLYTPIKLDPSTMAPTLGLHSAVFWNCLWKENAEFWWSLWKCGCPVVSFYFNIALYHLCSSPYTVCEFTWRIILSTRRFFESLHVFQKPEIWSG